MSTSLEDQKDRAIQYAAERNLVLDFDDQLGFGNDGIVWPTNEDSAVKVYERWDNYNRELGCYQRLSDLSVDQVGDFKVPLLIDFDDDLLIVEMAVVYPPFLLDFGKAYLDRAPDYPPEAIADWEAERREIFGDRWPQVQEALSWLRSYGIYYYDAKVGNITFGDED